MEVLLHLVTELQEEMSRSRSIKECKRENDYWDRTLPSLRWAQQADRMHDTEQSLSFLHLAECNDLRGSRQW